MQQRKRKDSGFALLLVLLMAAIIAINLYIELPRVAVESQRQKEQLLILRGEQYKRAILVFYKTNGSWPTKIDDLESFNNRRFLRRRYKDPMSGTDDWRLIHYNNGVFTDSVDNKPKSPNGSQKQTASTEGQYVGINAAFNGEAGANGSTGPTGPNLGRRRESDGGTGGGTLVNGASDPTAVTGVPGATGSTGSTGTQAGGPPGMPGMPVMPGMPGSIPPGTNPDGSTPGATSANGGAPGMPGQPGVPPGMPGIPGFPGVPGAPVNSQTGGVSPYSTAPGANGTSPPFGQPGTTAPGAMTAQQMIGNILGSPRPGGMPTSSTSGTGLTIGGGIAGVASKVDDEGIMVYNNHTNYKEWEFIFDPTKWKPPANPLAGAGTQGTPASQIGSMPTGPVGTSVNDIVNQQNGTSNNLNTTGGAAGTNTTGPVVKQQ